MRAYRLSNAQTHLSRRIGQACAGDEINITPGKQPLGRLVPLQHARTGLEFGAMRGR